MTVREFDEVCKKMDNVNLVMCSDNQPRGTVLSNISYSLQFTKVVCAFGPQRITLCGDSGSIGITNVDHINCDESGEIFTILCKDGESVVINTV